MEYGININYFKKTLSLEKAVELIARAGFTQLDYTPPVQEDNWKEQMLEAAALFRAYGLSVHQTHSPFNRYGRYGDQHKLCIDRCAEATEYLGAKFMVAHGDEFDYANLTFSPEAALAYNHDYYLPYVERAAKNGYKIAFETVFDDSMGRRFTSQADELMGLITSYHSDTVVCCWDFGHANVTFRREAPAILRRFGTLVQCMHLHDNTGVDAHQLPMTGDINWQETMSVLHEIGYTGIMSIEYSHGAMPEHLAAVLIDLTYRTAKHLWEM